MANTARDEKDTSKAYFEKHKDLINKIFKKCKEESESGLKIPLESYEERVVNYTGVPRYLFKEISEQKFGNVYVSSFKRAKICDALKMMYKKYKSFSFKEIHELVKIELELPDFSQFCLIMSSLGYAEGKNTLNYGPIVLEDPKLTYDRFLYLNKIMKFRALARNKNTLIYYLDERVIDNTRAFQKPWLNNTTDANLDSFIYYHIVSKNGYEKGLFCNQMNAADLKKWLCDIVLPCLKPSSVMVMDRSPLHGQPIPAPITRYHSKEHMVEWLQRNNVPCSSSMRKAQLYDLITRCPGSGKHAQYDLDLVFKSHGHEVLRLPQNYHDLSITELMWEHIISLTKNNDFEKAVDVKNLVHNLVTSIPSVKWYQFERLVETREKGFFMIDQVIEKTLEHFEIDLKDIDSD